MNTKLYIPQLIKVGFQKRDDTYTGKLGYVIYRDDKKVWRKEKSWNGWRDEKVKPVELENVPHSGFHLNKGVERYGYWGSGRSMCRVYDDRGFEFEITIDNLMFILMGSDCSKRELAGEFVYSWNGMELVLLPVNSQEYEESKKFTSLQGGKVNTKDLIEGATYVTKKGSKLIYLGKFNVNSFKQIYSSHHRSSKKIASFAMKYVFHTAERAESDYELESYIFDHTFQYKDTKFIFFNDLDKLANCIVEEPTENYSKYVDEFLKTSWGSKITNVETQTITGEEILHSSKSSKPYYHSSREESGYNLKDRKDFIGEAFEYVSENTYRHIQIHVLKVFVKDDVSYSYGKMKQTGYALTSTKIVNFNGTEINVKNNSKKDDKVYTEKEINSLLLHKLNLSLECNSKHPLSFINKF